MTREPEPVDYGTSATKRPPPAAARPNGSQQSELRIITGCRRCGGTDWQQRQQVPAIVRFGLVVLYFHYVVSPVASHSLFATWAAFAIVATIGFLALVTLVTWTCSVTVYRCRQCKYHWHS